MWVERHRQKVSTHTCGHSREKCSDPSARFYPQRSVCYASMELDAANARYDELHSEKSGAVYHDGTFENWSATRTPQFPYHYRAGVTIWTADVDLAPEDQFLSVAEQSQPDESRGEG